MQYHPTHDEIRLLDDALSIDDPFERGNAVKAWFYDPDSGAIRITPRTIGTVLDYLAILVHYAMEGGADLNAEARLAKVDARLEYYRAKTESMAALEGRDRVAGEKDDVGSPIGAYFLEVANPLLGMVPNIFPEDPAFGKYAGQPINYADFQLAIIEARAVDVAVEARSEALKQVIPDLWQSAKDRFGEAKDTIKAIGNVAIPGLAIVAGLYLFTQIRR
ncbi:MAG: hypothetical protein GY930_18025 [bacterium]|nr:hypothetical protein [Hyphomicrobium sp.]MCP5023653.1 hypothetical protein [bacterium]